MDDATPDPRAEFSARLRTITPRVVIAPALIAINVLVFLAMIVNHVSPLDPTTDSLMRWGADFGPRTVSDREWWRLLTSMFLHIGIIHLAFNMLVLWQAGWFMERLLGNIGFLIVYLVSGLGGALVSIAWHPYVVSAGASGAIFGLYGAMLGYVALRRDSIPSQILAPLTKGALVFLAYNLLYGYLRRGTDIADHIGGLCAGFVCGLALAVPLTVAPPPRRAIRNAAVLCGGGIILAALALKLPRSVDFVAEMRAFSAIESKSLAAYRGALEQAQSKKLSNEELAGDIEKNVLPEWETEYRKLAGLKGLPQTMQVPLTGILKYMQARGQGWALIARGLRAHDRNILTAGALKEREAEQIASDLAKQNAGQKP